MMYLSKVTNHITNRFGKWDWIWPCTILGVSLFLICTTYLFGVSVHQLSHFRPMLKQQFQLAIENNFASWWSGMLLLLTALRASDGFFSSRLNKQHTESRGWATLALILAILSADEIGSIHERASKIIYLGGVWWSILPFALILVSLLIYSFFAFFRSKIPWHRLMLMAIGFLLLSSVAFQEFLEHKIIWESWMKPMRRALEEGSELIGILILLKACAPNTKGIFDKKFGVIPTFEIVWVMRNVLVVLSLIAAPFLAYITSLWADPLRVHFEGHPADWLSAVLFVFAALAVAQRFFKEGKILQIPELLLIGVCCFASISSVACPPGYTIVLLKGAVSFRMFVLFLVVISICILIFLVENFGKSIFLNFGLPILVIATASLFTTADLIQYGSPILIGAIIYRMNVLKIKCYEPTIDMKLNDT